MLYTGKGFNEQATISLLHELHIQLTKSWPVTRPLLNASLISVNQVVQSQINVATDTTERSFLQHYSVCHQVQNLSGK